jgi:hypothetical protein
LIIYYIEGADRVLGAHLLLTMLLLILNRHYILVLAVLVVHLLIAPSFLSEYNLEWKDNFSRFNPGQMDSLRASLSEDGLVYQANAPSPWCNTVFVPLTFYNYRITSIPAGMGISFYAVSIPPSMPLKSKYLILNDRSEKKLTLEGNLNLKFIKNLPYGILYENLDSVCVTGGGWVP